MWGRVLGLVFAVPAAAFAVSGAIKFPLAQRLGLLFLMGGTQGLVGWWMVRSGLQVSHGGSGRLLCLWLFSGFRGFLMGMGV